MISHKRTTTSTWERTTTSRCFPRETLMISRKRTTTSTWERTTTSGCVPSETLIISCKRTTTSTWERTTTSRFFPRETLMISRKRTTTSTWERTTKSRCFPRETVMISHKELQHQHGKELQHPDASNSDDLPFPFNRPHYAQVEHHLQGDCGINGRNHWRGIRSYPSQLLPSLH